MIDMTTENRSALDYRKTGLERQQQTASSNSVSIEADLTAAEAEIAALNTVMASLPDGPVKDETQVRLTKAIYKKFLLDQRKVNYGSIALVDREFDIACAVQSIAEADALLLALNNRMGELPAI